MQASGCCYDIIGTHKGEYVACAYDFPDPLIENCNYELKEISYCDRMNGYEQQHGHNEELADAGAGGRLHHGEEREWKGYCLLNEKYAFEIEDIVFKVSLYGTIHRGWILERHGLELKRTCEEFQIVAKKFKKVDVHKLSRADDPIQEFSALQYIGNDHPNVLGQIACLQDEEYYYSIMKFCDGGELCSRILGVGPVGECQARSLFLQLLDGLDYLQSKGIFHRDISLENILITSSTSPQLMFIDFGMCLRVPLVDDGTFRPYFLPPMPAKGKKSYMAPEIVAESTPYNGFQSDIWSLGIVLFTMLTGKFIVTHASPLCQLFRHVRNGRLKDMCRHWQLGLSESVQSLLFEMLSVDPAKRLTIAEIRKHAWCMETNETPAA